MAAGSRKPGTEDVRAGIPAGRLIDRLVDHGLADEPVLDASQVRAIDLVLKKILPDLSSVQHRGDEDRPIVHEVRRIIVRPGA
jgi:hypothetical protein